MPTFSAIILSTFISVSLLFSQESSSRRANDLRKYFQFDNPNPLACLFTYFPSIFIQHDMELRSFIRSKAFQHLREEFGDARSVDAIYIRAMQLTNNNTAVSLLLSAMATFDHRVIALKLPIFQFALPLTDESNEEFSRRVRNLPRIIYDDSPESGDRDKLQHIFGSAFLTYVSESRGSADRFGVFVEKGERAFIVGGTYDERDLRADWQGENFGAALLKNNRRLPSDFLAPYPAPVKTQSVSQQRSLINEPFLNPGLSQFSCEGP